MNDDLIAKYRWCIFNRNWSLDSKKLTDKERKVLEKERDWYIDEIAKMCAETRLRIAKHFPPTQITQHE